MYIILVMEIKENNELYIIFGIYLSIERSEDQEEFNREDINFYRV